MLTLRFNVRWRDNCRNPDECPLVHRVRGTRNRLERYLLIKYDARARPSTSEECPHVVFVIPPSVLEGRILYFCFYKNL